MLLAQTHGDRVRVKTDNDHRKNRFGHDAILKKITIKINGNDQNASVSYTFCNLEILLL